VSLIRTAENLKCRKEYRCGRKKKDGNEREGQKGT
jgi:hypothetical protein